MIVVEVTLAIALVAGAGRLLLSMQHLLAIDPGFTAEGRLAIDVLLPPRPVRRSRTPGRVVERSRTAAARHWARPAIGVASSLPLRHEWDSTTFVDITNRPTEPGQPAERPAARRQPRLLRGVRHRGCVAGRSFTARRSPGRRAGRRRQSRVGAEVHSGARSPARARSIPAGSRPASTDSCVPQDAEIIGVVEDVPYSDLTKAAEPTVYVSDAQVPTWRRSIVITAADGRPGTTGAANPRRARAARSASAGRVRAALAHRVDIARLAASWACC